MIILGIGGILGDAASAILKDGELVAAVEESKLVRRRPHWGGQARCPSRPSPPAWNWPASKPEQVDAVALSGPFPRPTST